VERSYRESLAGALIAAAFLLFAPLARPSGRLPAVEVFQGLQQSLVDDKKRADWHTFLADAERLKAFLNGSPTSGLEVARADLELGRQAAAAGETRRFLKMGQMNDILDTPLFKMLQPAIDAPTRADQVPVSLARAAIALSDADLLPEDIDYDPASKRFLVTSILKHDVISIDETGHQAPFVMSPSRWPMLALKVDARRRRLWATEVALDGFSELAPSEWGHSALLEYDLDAGTLLARFEGPPHSNLGDMALAPDGDPIVSDGVGGGIYRLKGRDLVRIDRGDFVSPQTIAICADGTHAFVPDYIRGIAAFDLRTGTARWLSMQDRYALDGIDGLYCRNNAFIAIQNGTSPERVAEFSLNVSKTAIESQRIVEQGTSTLGDPTHGVFVGTAFYFIANSGWNALDEHGAMQSTRHLTSAVIMRVEVSALK
jgi:hypothetical protein